MLILEDKIKIIKHCRKSLLYYNEGVWIKKGVSGNFNNPMGEFDGSKICELVRCLFHKISITLLTPVTMVVIETTGCLL